MSFVGGGSRFDADGVKRNNSSQTNWYCKFKKRRHRPRDANGQISRSRSAVAEFKRMTGYPHGRPGYVVDHIVPLALGGADPPANMQWQTVEAAKDKDRWELIE